MFNEPVYIGLIHNTALLMFMVLLQDLAARNRKYTASLPAQALAGAVLGGIGIGVLLTPWTMSPGLFFDARSILFSLAGLFFGAVPALTAAVITGVFRLLQGGEGALLGAAAIFVFTAIGLIWRGTRRERLDNLSLSELYLFGLAVHAVMLVSMLARPWEQAREILANIAVWVMLVYPLATAVLGHLMRNRLALRRQEEDIRRSELKFRRYVEDSPLGIFIFDAAGTFLDVNEAACAMSGYCGEELLGRHLSEFLPEKSVAPALESLAALLRQGRISGETPFLHKSGRKALWSYDLVKLDEATNLGFAADITERERARKTLLKEAQRRHILMERNIDGIVILDKDYRAVEANLRFGEMLGRAPGEVLGMQCWDWDATMTEAEIRAAFPPLPRLDCVFQTKHRRKDGTAVDVEVSASGMEIDGEHLCFTVVRDITGRKRSEDALRESEAKYRTLFEALQDPVLVADVETGRIVECNTAAATYFGLSRDELIGRHQSRFHPPQTLGEGGMTQDFLDHIARQGLHDDVAVLAAGGLTRLAAIQANIFEMAGRRLLLGIFRDVTERRQTKEALDKEAQRRRILMERSIDGIVILDKDYRVVEANRRFGELLGYAPGEVLGMHSWDWDAAMTEAEIRAAFPDISVTNEVFETKHRRKDGTVFDVEVSASGAVICGEALVITVNRDITERRQAQDALARSELNLRTIADYTFDWEQWLDVEGKPLWISPSCERITGYSAEEFTGDPGLLLRIIHPEDRELFLAQEQTSRGADNGVSNFDCRIVTKSGKTAWINHSSLAIFTPEGAPLGRRVSNRDVTIRRAAEEELKRQSSLLTSLIDSTPDLIFIKNPQGVYLGCNPAFCEFVGKPQEEISGRTDAELFGPEVAAAFARRDRIILDVRGTLRDDSWVTFPNGRQMLIETLRAPLFDADGGVIGLIGMGRDVTLRHKLEEDQRLAREAAEKANAAKSMFLANMSHEIRTPLNGLMGMMQMLRTTALSVEQKEFVDLAIRSGSRLTRLLCDILDLSRVESGRIALEEKPFRIADIFSALTDTFEPLCIGKGLFIRPWVAPDVPPTVVGDEVRVRQIIFNLVGNAMKFSPAGEITVSIMRLAPISEKMIRLLFTVGDHGAGIPDRLVNAVCDAFTQGEDSFARSQQGAGLGLAITHNLVALMGGTLTFDSEPGRGTDVYVMLPLGLAEALPAEAPAAATPCGASRETYRILLAEDDIFSQIGTKRYLETLGHTVECAGDGKTALELLRREPFDCILMDIQMLVMDGVEATRRIRAGEAGEAARNVPIIAVTAYAMNGDAQRFQEAGMDHYISKPVDFEELCSVMDGALAGHKGS
jgi:PAS domain S-box-containing protein